MERLNFLTEIPHSQAGEVDSTILPVHSHIPSVHINLCFNYVEDVGK